MSQDNKVEVKIKKVVRITKPVRLSDYIHRQLKIEAASQETTVSKLLDEAVIDYFGFSINQTIKTSDDNFTDHEELRTTI